MNYSRLLIIFLFILSVSPVYSTDTYSYYFSYYLSDSSGGLRAVSTISVFETIDDSSTSRMLVTHRPAPRQELSLDVIRRSTHDRVLIKRATPDDQVCVKKYRPESSLITPSEYKPVGSERVTGKGKFHNRTERIRRESHIASEVVTIIEKDVMRVAAYQKSMPINANIPGPNHHLWGLVRQYLSIAKLECSSASEASPYSGYRVSILEKRAWTEDLIRNFSSAFSREFLDFIFGLDCRYDIIALVDKNLNIFALEIIDQTTGGPAGFLMLENVVYEEIERLTSENSQKNGNDSDECQKFKWLFRHDYSHIDP
ncbi:hypothetical protein [Endozoicomonas arenosclerae]|uniref:hypothetical protein n=1 Tax=Endozoicomonas arenosclerae TaxID=1633495 RepID=UPI000B1D47C7|nr:hypothetical protein [Endozoicomonas arenosclerae]